VREPYCRRCGVGCTSLVTRLSRKSGRVQTVEVNYARTGSEQFQADDGRIGGKRTVKDWVRYTLAVTGVAHRQIPMRLVRMIFGDTLKDTEYLLLAICGHTLPDACCKDILVRLDVRRQPERPP
jgi:hypothetical protein